MRLKKILATLILAVTLASSFCLGANATEVTKYGITYDNAVYNARFSVARDLITRNPSDGIVLGIMTYQIGQLKSKTKVSGNTNEQVIVVKMIMEPQKNYSKSVFGVSEYLRCSMSLPSTSVNTWQPTNDAPTDNWTFGIGAEFGKGSGVTGNVSVSTTVEKERLDVEADVRPSSQRAIFNYDYKPYKTLNYSKTKNKYFRNSSIQYCVISVNANSYNSMYFDFGANFTYSREQYAKPSHVIFGSHQGTTTYEWTLSSKIH